jgi:hypothetical protein
MEENNNNKIGKEIDKFSIEVIEDVHPTKITNLDTQVESKENCDDWEIIQDPFMTQVVFDDIVDQLTIISNEKPFGTDILQLAGKILNNVNKSISENEFLVGRVSTDRDTIQDEIKKEVEKIRYKQQYPTETDENDDITKNAFFIQNQTESARSVEMLEEIESNIKTPTKKQRVGKREINGMLTNDFNIAMFEKKNQIQTRNKALQKNFITKENNKGMLDTTDI